MTGPIRAVRLFVSGGGRHRQSWLTGHGSWPRIPVFGPVLGEPVPGALVPQRFVTCAPCGGVESAATIHGDGQLVLCAEGHVQDGGL